MSGKKYNQKRVITFIVLLFLTLQVFPVSALTSKSASGISLSPPIQSFQLGQGQSNINFTYTLTNSTPSSVEVSLSGIDFTSYGTNGSVNFLSASQDHGNRYGLASNFSFPVPQIVVPANQSDIVPVQITNANTLSPGGHYAGVLFKVTSLVNSSNTANISLKEELTGLVFVSTYGGGLQYLSLNYSSIGSLVTNYPNALRIILSNTGNTQTTPLGVVQIVSSSKHVIEQSQINTSSNLILPGTARIFNIDLNHTSLTPHTGFYYLKIFYKTPNQKGYSLYTKRFLYVSKEAIILGIVIILLVIVLLRKKIKKLESITKYFNS